MKARCAQEFEVGQEESQILTNQVSLLKNIRNTCFKNLCWSKRFCKDKNMILQEKAIEHFENQLDIRSIVETRIDLNILLSILMNKE